MLKEVGCPVTSARAEGYEGKPDPELLQALGERRMAWITKDDAARSTHATEIGLSSISVVWIRGAQRKSGTTQRNVINTKQLLHILVARIDDIAKTVAEAHGPRYFLLSMSNNKPKLQIFSTIQDVGKRLARPG